MPATVILNRVWTNPNKAYEVSMWGARPVGSDWTLTDKGFTIQWPDGTVGSNVPGCFKTKEEAQAYIDARPHFPGYSQG